MVDKPHKKLDSWKESIDLTITVYEITGKIPTDEKFGLISQMRRAAVSIASNIAEGTARNSNKEFIHFLYVAHGSLAELDTQCVISEALGYITDGDSKRLNKRIETVGKLIFSLINHLKNKGNR